ncbi:MAG TPA: zinc-dependent metalloprotease family protein [Candidatus Acidoferrum sp.]|nr:zinc-dependent metalloprotease family protein [Candidatus Acidoferrum sp.]
MSRFISRGSVTLLLTFLCSIIVAAAQPRPREFRRGSLRGVEDLPLSRLRSRIERLPAAKRVRALEHLKDFHFTESDLPSLDVDDDGAIYYADHFANSDPVPAEEDPVIAEAAAPVAPFPNALVFHSRPGASNIIYLNFTGDSVTGTAWNTSLSRSTIPAVAFSTDSDYSTFSDAEQTAIKRIWMRVAEDFAPFNVDVTTERPATFTTRTAHALITRNTDANGSANPSSGAGGVAYISSFATSTYAKYRPAWIYANNFSGTESYIAEAVSHEVGHNLGLSHDGTTSGSDYYGGHGSGNTSWGPIMGTGYSRNVSQWCKGEYYLANNTQDDLTTIAAKIPFRADDHGDTTQSATPLAITAGSNVVATTPEIDPVNASTANKGVLSRGTDIDVFSFATGNGGINLRVNSWMQPAGTRGGNVDLLVELRDANGSLVLTSNPTADTAAQIQTVLTAGTYYLHVRNTGVGNPIVSGPSGYTSYGSIGQYFISGSVASPSEVVPVFQLTATANNSTWGSVTPTNGSYPAGASVQVSATPASHYRFVGWTNGASGSSNPLAFTLETNRSVQARFAEIFTTNNPTPHSWLAANGVTGDFENAVDALGANGLPLWQSYIAGLNPRDATSQLRLSRNGNELRWNPIVGRAYNLWWNTNIDGPFTLVPGASNISATVTSFTNIPSPEQVSTFYRIEARLP